MCEVDDIRGNERRQKSRVEKANRGLPEIQTLETGSWRWVSEVVPGRWDILAN